MNDNDKLINALKDKFGTKSFSRLDVEEVGKGLGLTASIRWFLRESKHRVGHGEYRVIESFKPAPTQFETDEVDFAEAKNPQSAVLENIRAAEHRENLIPEADPLFVKHGPYEDISKIIAAGIFYPLFITGLSGNGKTFSVEQACAEHGREMIRVNVTIETDEDDLLGGFRLVNDSTKWFDGPVVRAMKSGAVLLLDEVDLGSTKLLCLQPVLEGKGVLLKKINQFIKPADGFTIIATANTKGQGSESGKFVGTNVLNEAFLERFPITFEQKYPEEAAEKNILNRVFAKFGVDQKVGVDFGDKLIKWADNTRKAFEADGAASDIISTRRLVHIVHAYAVLGDRRKAIQLCINRFDATTKASFIQLYEKFDPTVVPERENRGKLDLDNADENEITKILSKS